MALELTESDDWLLQRYAKPIAHMRWQLHQTKRFGVIFGAGASQDLGFPKWHELVERVANSPEVDHATLMTEVQKPLPIVAEVTYHHFRQRHINEVRKRSSNASDAERLITAKWVELIHRCLYEKAPDDPEELLKRDTVYRHFLPVIRESPMTVNYNYDDSVQRLLLLTRSDDEKEKGRGFETITHPNLQHSRTKGVIYHPNGFLPRIHLERTSEKIVFNDGTYAEQMVEVMTGAFTSLLHHLSMNTCLLVGLSLSDETLRHLLHKSALSNPGHYHYHVDYRSSPTDVTPAMKAEAAANFETYNLITLFLDTEGIASLGRCLAAKASDLRARAEEKSVRLSYTYYFTGVPGVGKTTALSYFKNLRTQGEWLDERLPEMSKPFPSLTDDERAKVDKWIMTQVGLKNRRLLEAERELGIGITVVDRCVPDAVSFTQPEGWSDKAKALIDAVSPGASHRTVHPGHVILFVGDPREIRVRAATKNKETTEKYIEDMQQAISHVYGENGVTQLDVRQMTIGQVVKDIARIIHLEEYTDCNLHNRLEEIRDEKIAALKPIEVS